MDGLHRIHLDGLAGVHARTAQISKVGQRINRPGQVADLGDEGVAAPTVRGLKPAARANPVAREGLAGDVGVTGGIDRDAITNIVARSTQVSAVDGECEPRFRGDLRYEGVQCAWGAAPGARRY